MANAGKIADVWDALISTIDARTALTTWLTARNGRKYYFFLPTSADAVTTNKIPLDFSKVDVPAFLLLFYGMGAERFQTDELVIPLKARILFITENPDPREMMDFYWHLFLALFKGARPANWLGLSYVFSLEISEAYMDTPMLNPELGRNKPAYKWGMDVKILVRVNPDSET